MNTKRKQDEFFNIARHTMVECQIRPDGVIREDILSAFSNMPREAFIPQNLHGVAYQDDTLIIEKGRFILPPSVHARMIEALDPKEKHIALDISSSNGYSTAILAAIVSTVIVVEPKEDHLDKIAKTWQDQNIFNAVGVHGPLHEGATEHAPFDLAFIHGTVKKIPADIVAQLKPGGRLVCIVREQKQSIGQATLVYKTVQGGYTTKILFETTAPYVPGFAPKSENFVF